MCAYGSPLSHAHCLKTYQEYTEALILLENEDGALEGEASGGASSAATTEAAGAIHESSDASEALPPFLGRAASTGRSGGDMAADERAESASA